MKTITVEKNHINCIWTVRGNNVIPCINDIKCNQRIENDAYTISMFRQRYGCTAIVKKQKTQPEEVKHSIVL